MKCLFCCNKEKPLSQFTIAKITVYGRQSCKAQKHPPQNERVNKQNIATLKLFYQAF
jgi:hypothetical protein